MRFVILMVSLWLATSPLQSKIVFYSNRDGNEEIYTMDSDGSNQQRLTFNETRDGWPVWSPNGQQIVFHSNRDGNWEIYVMDADGSNQRNLTRHPGDDGYPDWSPDGKQIAFDSDRFADEPPIFHICVMDADGGNVKQVTDTFFAQRPRWSPGGEWILFMEGEIFAIRPDGTDLWQVSAPKADASMFLDGWSPDGKQILYTEAINASVNDATPVIATLDPADPQRVFKWVLVNVPLKALATSSFSADGKSILVAGKKDFVIAEVEGDPWNIYRLHLADRKLIQLTDSPGDDMGAHEWNPALSVPPNTGRLPVYWGEMKAAQ